MDESGFVLPDTWHPDACVKISALIGTHIEDLKRAIWKVMVGDTGVVREVEIVPNLRHKSGLEQCLALLQARQTGHDKRQTCRNRGGGHHGSDRPTRQGLGKPISSRIF